MLSSCKCPLPSIQGLLYQTGVTKKRRDNIVRCGGKETDVESGMNVRLVQTTLLLLAPARIRKEEGKANNSFVALDGVGSR